MLQFVIELNNLPATSEILHLVHEVLLEPAPGYRRRLNQEVVRHQGQSQNVPEILEALQYILRRVKESMLEIHLRRTFIAAFQVIPSVNAWDGAITLLRAHPDVEHGLQNSMHIYLMLRTTQPGKSTCSGFA